MSVTDGELNKLLDDIENLKLQGNAEFKKAKLFTKHTAGKNMLCDSCVKYAKALELSQAIDTDEAFVASTFPKELMERHRALKLSLFLNLAATSIKLESWDSALNSCNAALELDAKNVKALFRRAQIFQGQRKLSDAEQDLVTAIHLQPSNKELRALLKQIRVGIKKEHQAEELKRATELGAARTRKQKQQHEETTSPRVELVQEDDTDVQPQEEAKSHNAENVQTNSNPSPVARDATKQIPLDFKGSLESALLTGYLRNGGENEHYLWGQTLDELHLFFQVNPKVSAKNVKCTFARTRVSLSIDEETTPRLDNISTTKHVTADECTWQLESPGVLHLCLFKEKVSDGEQGHEWWNSPFVSHPTIDVAECSVGTNLSELPDKQKKMVSKILWEEKNKSPEEKERDKQIREAELEMQRDEERRKRSDEIAKSNPNKQAIFDMMKKNFPDVPVEFR